MGETVREGLPASTIAILPGKDEKEREGGRAAPAIIIILYYPLCSFKNLTREEGRMEGKGDWVSEVEISRMF